MSKSSKRRLAAAAIKNAQAESTPQRGIGLQTDVPSPSPSTASLCRSATLPLSPASALNTHNSPLPESSVLSVPSDPYVLSPSASSPPLNSQFSTFNSPSNSPSPEISNLKSSDYLSSPPFTKPSEFFKTHFEPHCPPENFDSVYLPPIVPDPNNPAGPIDSQLELYQSKLKPIFANLSPDDPNVERISHNYIIIMQIATVERLIHSLPGLSEKAMVETNNQIVRMLSIIERTNSRRARELREKDAAARRIIREQQRKERQAQKEAEAIARAQRNQQREENRRQREQLKADRAAQKHELAMRKLDLKERDIKALAKENDSKEKLDHHSPGKPADSIAPSAPVPNV